VLSPPLIITKAEVDMIVTTLRAAIEKVTVELTAEGLI
jgi:adenosylmethionine-8-amino-7-oxononanoate aminotransferase